MALNIYKPVDNQQHISILIPTRGRPHRLQNVFTSIEDTIKHRSLVDVWIYIDDDDDITRRFVSTCPEDGYSFRINYLFGQRTTTMGGMINTLREKCMSNPGIYMPAADDYLFVTKEWDEIVRDAFNRCPDRILLAYPVDPIVGPDRVTHPILSAEWTNVLGRFLTEYFPFWSDDTWLDQVSQMVQRRTRLDMRMEPQDGKGKTPRMKNLIFWQHFFDNTIEERIKDADLLRRAIYPEKTADYYRNLANGQELAARFRKEFRRIKDVDRLVMQKSLSGGRKKEHSPLSSSYRYLERNAVAILQKKLFYSIKSGLIIKSVNVLGNILFATPFFKDVRYCGLTFHMLLRAMYRRLKNPARYPEYAIRIWRLLITKK